MWCKKALILSVLCFVIKAAPDAIEPTTPANVETTPNEALISGGGQKISVELDTCTLKINITNTKGSTQNFEPTTKKPEERIVSAEKGEKGDKGDIGPQGIKGDRGEEGKRGDTGPPGKEGIAAEKGEKGDRGDVGAEGKMGLTGLQGLPGLKGEKGEPGEKCKTIADSVSPPEQSSNFSGSATNPAKTCNDIDTKDDGIYSLNPAEPFMVTCSFSKNQVCLFKKKLNTTEKFGFLGDQFLLSEIGFMVQDLYGITLTQLAYLNSWTMGGKQVIKYHCDNTIVFNEYTPEKSLQLLMWNDNLVGPARTPDTPVYYRVKNDKCSESKVGGHALIEISAQTNNRLPVVDFYIRDRNTDASVSLSLIELCLNFVN